MQVHVITVKPLMFAIGEVCGWGGGLAPKPLIMDNIFFKTESAHDTYYIP